MTVGTKWTTNHEADDKAIQNLFEEGTGHDNGEAAGSGADDGGDGETSRFHHDHPSPFISHPVSVSSFPALSRESMPER